jgi:hypothetical protein
MLRLVGLIGLVVIATKLGPDTLILCLILGVIPGAIAQSKGRNFIDWWLYGALLFVVALLHALAISGKKCPYCAEVIKPEACVCHYCGRDVPAVVVPDKPRLSAKAQMKPLWPIVIGTYVLLMIFLVGWWLEHD